METFTSYTSETEGNRLNQVAPFTGLSSAFDMKFWNSLEARRAEIASANGLANARSLAVVAGHLASSGASGLLLSPPAWREMHDLPTEGSTFGMTTNFSQGGVNQFGGGKESAGPARPGEIVHYGDQVPPGLFGWGGYGGSVFLWSPQHNIGFAYIPTYLAWYDRGKQRAINCLRKLFDCLQ